MRRVVRAVFGVVAAAVLVGNGTGAAQAAPDGGRVEGAVLVFETEVTPTVRHENPSGCVKLSPLAHLLVNRTDSDVRVHTDPRCLTPGLVVPPGTGVHLAPLAASFSA